MLASAVLAAHLMMLPGGRGVVPRDHPSPDATSVVARTGDTLTSISGDSHRTLTDVEGWNPQIANPDVIYAGERIAVARGGPHSPAEAMRAVRPPVGDRLTVKASPPVSAPSGTGQGDLAYQACVIRRESGGDPGARNPSGHWGLYQFSAATWAAFGGDPALFETASASYQAGIFWTVMRAGGEYGTWSEWDGCPLP